MRRIKTAVGFIYYNDLESIKRSIPSFVEHFDYVIAVDGRFSMRVGEDYSSDGSTEYLQQFENVIIKKFVGMEPAKRNVYMEESRRLNVDALLMVDTDEYIVETPDEGGWDVFHKFVKKVVTEQVWPMWSVQYMEKDIPRAYSRLYTHLDLLNYADCHCLFKINGHTIHISSDPIKYHVLGIHMIGDDALRDETWVKLTEQYQRKLLVYEKPIKSNASYMLESRLQVTSKENIIYLQDVLSSNPNKE